MNKPPTFEPLGRITSGSSHQRRFPIAVVAFVVLHGVFFAGLLLQGCRPKTPDETQAQAPTNALPNVNDLWNRLSTTPTPTPAPTNRVVPPSPAPTNRVEPPIEEDTPPPANRDLAALGQTTPPSSQVIVTNPAPVAVTPPVGPTHQETQDLAQAREHEIKPAETLWGIGQQYGVSVADLERANPNVVPTRLKPGTVLIIPPKRETPAAPAAPAYPGTLHQIEKNETLNSI
ncbi:MAG: LysM peptidoglycan-binding domain-containing protein [Verrucomicrobiae bacterium]|nr:LysM peptidoglycan-binding domain-containing protein [Verrucomicrobiae bacterium]